MRNIHAVIFDMDGVLVDNKEIHRKEPGLNAANVFIAQSPVRILTA